MWDAVRVQIGALGPLTIGGRTVEGSRLPALLLPLLLARGRIVSVTDLVEAVWEGAPPADPAGALQALVSRTRRLGLTITATAGGYRLDPRHLEVDVLVAQDLLASARAATSAGDVLRAADLARQALVLWSDDTGAPTVGPYGRVFTDLLAIRVEGELVGLETGAADGSHFDEDLLDSLRDAVRQRPSDEPLTALMMRALAVDGREAEAFATYEQLRGELAETFGTDPSAVAATVHLALLRGELHSRHKPLAPSGSAREPAPTPALQPPTPGWRRPATSMLGRDADVAALEQQLARHALVTLVAVGGAGKTRLAVELARRATDRGEAVHAVELAGVRDPLEILPTLLSSLGASESTADADDLRGRRVLDPHERMLRAVAALDGLLVLDNCEHLLAAVADVTAQVLAVSGPHLRILATSRAPLGVVGEVVHPVDTLTDDDALALLEARGRAVRPTLAWDAAAALELCHRLDNLPLALELAAARLRSMPLEDVLAGIAHRFALLDNALRGLPDRHQGLWAMVDWSWALLDPQGRALLCNLAVVPAPFTADAAAALAGLANDTTARTGLALLVEQSLLTLEEPGDGRPSRYRMLETVREYGEARLAADGARDAVMERLAGWAARESRALRDDYIGGRQLAALQATTDDHDTFVAALRWAVDRDHEREAYAVAATLVTLWTIRGLHLEVITWARQLLHAEAPARRRASWERLRADGDDASSDPRGDGPDADDVAATASIVTVNSGIANDLRVSVLGLRLNRWALSAVGDLLSPRTAALARMTACFTSTDDAIHLAAASELLDDPDPYLHALGLFLRAVLRENQGEVLESAADAREAYAFFESVQDHWGMGMAAQTIGQWEAGREGERTDEWLTCAIHHLDLVGAVQDARTLLVVRDMRRALSGSAEAAVGLARTAASPSASTREQTHALLGLGVLSAQKGRWKEAADHADAAVRAARSDATTFQQGRIVTEVAAAVLRIRAGLDGEGLLSVAARGAFAIADMPVLGSVALGYAELAVTRGETERGDELWALGTRLGANLALMFGALPGASTLLAADGARDQLLEQARKISVADTVARLATLIGTS
jgi:predicted ATPase/DNA-binding SARP family transcriptional activator